MSPQPMTPNGDVPRGQFDDLTDSVVAVSPRSHTGHCPENRPSQRARGRALNPAYWGASEPRSCSGPACKIGVRPVQAGLPGGIIVSLILQSDTEARAAAPSRRSALRGVPPLPADAATAAEPLVSLIAPGWYADPMGSGQSRWWDGIAWTAELSARTPVEPVAAADAVAPAEAAVFATPADAGAPLSRRQLRELVGPLTTGPVPTDAPAETSPVPAPVVLGTPSAPADVAGQPPVAPGDSAAPSHFEALFELSTTERTPAESTVFTALIDPTEVPRSSLARPWIGAAVPVVPAASAPPPVAVEPAPTFAPVAFEAPPAAMTAAAVSTAPVLAAAVSSAPATAAPTFSGGILGFSLPPDPFATPSGAVEATPPPFVSLASSSPTAGPVLAISPRSTTAAVWVYALLPVVHAAALWLVLGLLDLGENPVIRYSVLGAPLVLSLLLAIIDGHVLRGRGFPRTASAVFALVPPLYLLVRAIRVGAAGVVPLLVWLLLQTAAFSFILLQLPGVFALVPLTSPTAAAPVVAASGPITAAQRATELTPSGMAAELTRQTLAKNLTFSSISCPPIPVTLDATTVSCVGILASVKMTLNVVIDSTLPNSAFALVSEAPAA